MADLAIRTDSGEQLDAHFTLEGTATGYDLTYGARWGRRGATSVGNSDYGPGLRLLLGRLRQAQAVLLDATIESARVRDLPHSARPRSGRAIPVDARSRGP